MLKKALPQTASASPGRDLRDARRAKPRAAPPEQAKLRAEPSELPFDGWLTPPIGTRDVLPPEASERRSLARALLGVYGRHGYSLVTTPPFERVDVLERLGTLRPTEVLQFVDADTGEVAVFRPDITPQIARLVATRLRDRPPPYRLAYEGHVLRRRLGRARRQRQIAQCGLECIGLGGAEGEAEIVEIAAQALERVGLTHFKVELALVPLARTLLDRLPPAHRTEATEALGRKDKPALQRAISDATAPTRRALEAMVDLYGDLGVLTEARRALKGQSELLRELARLESLAKVLTERGLEGRLAVDLGEVRGFGYYTGPSFGLLAEGPGEPLGSGGRYDDLLGRFGHPLQGAGFALDLDHVAWALRVASVRTSALSEVDCALIGKKGKSARELAASLRARGLRVADLGTKSLEEAMAWAQAWSVPFVVQADLSLHRVAHPAEKPVRLPDGDALAKHLVSHLVAAPPEPAPDVPPIGARAPSISRAARPARSKRSR